MTNENKILNLIGLAKKAGKAVVGDDTVMMSLRSNKLKIVFVANDASARTIDKYEKKCFFYNVEVNMAYNSNELNHAIGKENAKIVGITDNGFHKAIKELI